MRLFQSAVLPFLVWTLATAATAAEHSARAELVSDKGEKVGSATLVEAPNGVILTLRAAGLPPGRHGLHIHEIGRCDPPFQTAGGHLNPFGKKHGFLNRAGPHAGDLPNVHVAEDGTLQVEVFAPLVVLGYDPTDARNALLDSDGSAIVLHAAPDDHLTDPAGQAGGRIACGVVTR